MAKDNRYYRNKRNNRKDNKSAPLIRQREGLVRKIAPKASSRVRRDLDT